MPDVEDDDRFVGDGRLLPLKEHRARCDKLGYRQFEDLAQAFCVAFHCFAFLFEKIMSVVNPTHGIAHSMADKPFGRIVVATLPSREVGAEGAAEVVQTPVTYAA